MKKFISFLLVAISCFSSVRASEPAIWTVNTRAEIFKGDAEGVSIDETGAITLAPKLALLAAAEQPYIWSSAIDANGAAYLGTGSDGKIFKVAPGGKSTLFYDTNELNVAALAIGKNGEIYAGTAPDGKVYRISPNGAAEIFFEPREKYIWSLALMPDGSLAVGTGEDGKIYLVKTARAAPEASLFFDTSATHIISMATDAQGNLYAGTDADGLVLRFAPNGKPFALLDSSLREIHDIAVGRDNSIYVLALSESASAAKTADADATAAAVATTETTAAPAAPDAAAKSRYDLSTAKSAIYRITPAGGDEIIWNSSDVTAFSIAANPNGGGVLIGTSDKGRIYSVSDGGRETLLAQSNEGQISTLKAVKNQVYATTSNQGKLYRFGADPVTEGTYRSPVFSAKSTAAWGRIWWRSSGGVTLQTRSGNTSSPDETWSDWSAIYDDQKGTAISSPKAKFLQWRAVLKNNAVLNEVNVSYLTRNIAPEVLSIQTLPTGVGLLPNPPAQIDPNIELAGLNPVDFGLPAIQNVPPRKVYLRGARSLQWTAEDRNGDRLEYDVYYRAVNEANFVLLREKLSDDFFTIDSAALADGRYIFKIVASDAPSNPNGLSLTGDRISEPVEIDNTPPIVAALGSPQKISSSASAKLVFEATDAASRLSKAEYSVNGSDWKIVFADDGISDSPNERYTLEIPLKDSGAMTVSLRVFDANGNVGSARVLVNK